jgi:hypothetical protein
MARLRPCRTSAASADHGLEEASGDDDALDLVGAFVDLGGLLPSSTNSSAVVLLTRGVHLRPSKWAKSTQL